VFSVHLVANPFFAERLHKFSSLSPSMPTPPSSRHVVVLVGPTASGKSSVSIPLARLLNAEIISADSRQVYKYMDVGTAKPLPEERAHVPHHFIDELPPDQEFNAGDFGVQGRKVIDAILGRGRLPLVVGGSGLYLQSLIDGFFEGPGADWEYRKILEERVQRGQLDELVSELSTVDPVSASTIDPTKPRRIIRALEVYHTTGKPLSVLQREGRIAINFIPVFFGLEWERAELYRRVDARCEEMLQNGLLEEIDRLEGMGYGPSLNALRTVGYAEGFAYRRGEISYVEMVRLFKQNSRRYAKRQITWFRRDERITWTRMEEGFSAEDVAEMIARKSKDAMRLPRPQSL
jgi:tRNA dimethylallyltransferase